MLMGVPGSRCCAHVALDCLFFFPLLFFLPASFLSFSVSLWHKQVATQRVITRPFGFFSSKGGLFALLLSTVCLAKVYVVYLELSVDKTESSRHDSLWSSRPVRRSLLCSWNNINNAVWVVSNDWWDVPTS
ncbi:MAG: hypothetical protein J3R72DRAFT_21021 [Linnemannia gamsii]|nr:MAG: hypothetical protein J3R72DRAFT_21021 [Linnemannia gamsii]